MSKEYIVITGGAGFIGSHLTELLQSQGYGVLVVDDLSTGLEAHGNLADIFILQDVGDNPPYDIASRMWEFKHLNIVGVVHLAAQSRIREGSFPVDIQANIEGAARVFDWASSVETVRSIVFASSGAVYGDDYRTGPWHETDNAEPISSYGISKLSGEHYLRLFAEGSGKAWFALRLGNVYGPRQRWELGAGAPTVFAFQLLNDSLVTLYNGGKSVRDYLYVEDAVRAFLICIRGTPGESGIFNVAGALSGQLAARFVLETMKRITAKVPKEIMVKPLEGDASSIILDPSRIKIALGWEPLIDFQEGAKRVAADVERRMHE